MSDLSGGVDCCVDNVLIRNGPTIVIHQEVNQLCLRDALPVHEMLGVTGIVVPGCVVLFNQLECFHCKREPSRVFRGIKIYC